MYLDKSDEFCLEILAMLGHNRDEENHFESPWPVGRARQGGCACMKISTKGRYALRLMIDVAEHSNGNYVSLKDIATRQELSTKYLEQIVGQLSKAGFLKSSRGAQGGYQLARSPEEYTVGDILRPLEGDLAPVECATDDGFCDRCGDCVTIELWQETATGLKYAATATPKVAVHRATADRTDAENRHLFAQLQANRRALVGHYLSSEELLLEDFLGEAGSRLVIPRPVGIGQKKMEEYRREYEEGRLLPPVAQPDIAPYEPEDTGIASLGEYTKAASRLTDAEMYEDFI